MTGGVTNAPSNLMERKCVRAPRRVRYRAILSAGQGGSRRPPLRNSPLISRTPGLRPPGPAVPYLWQVLQAGPRPPVLFGPWQRVQSTPVAWLTPARVTVWPAAVWQE